MRAGTSRVETALINPSAENMANYFYDEISAGLVEGAVRVGEVKVWETDTASATYRP